ncbi:TetR family transcriptional regulator [Pleomorphomonas diazotrophica]|uniref:TetR family transcriptional regulator n=1 Tax=Pleomorphomonas diazotrophica TaxID=1166257 RepID=A0A1I4UQB3_9HYPH|nr:TetR/AcrR family transcriptional regulator [Pleomorphomonas diazotrophica]PKR88313.1 TetR family transcriptional regulator [Pleomorphomonas diazotrophica]SFM90923.1 DNA-binding transcriptional regulator, AcrR family [Pleomorphomonas diazotrophica]
MADSGSAQGEGLRQRKRRETLERIRDRGIRLFIEKGYAATTLEEIAAAAGISRRTFFYYFKSKDEILLSLQADVGALLADALRRVPADRRPLDAIRDAAVSVCASIPEGDMIALDRLMRESEAVQARKQASYVEQEKALFAALSERWPDPARQTGLRLVAMLAIGAMRLASETFNREGGKRPMAELLNEAFDALDGEM